MTSHTFRYSTSADTTIRKWLPIAATSQGLASFQFPGDSVEVARLPPGRSAGAHGLVPGAAAVKFVGAADSVAAAGVTKVLAEDITVEAHDHSHGGVQVISKHEDKVTAALLLVDVMIVKIQLHWPRCSRIGTHRAKPPSVKHICPSFENSKSV
jgi:hypothetical protein